MNHLILFLALAGLAVAGPQTEPAGTEAAPAPPPPPRLGELTGTNVHVRSGPGTNYYSVTRLSAPQHVVVVGEVFSWYAIRPPDGCFSLVEQRFVDLDGASGGVINGNRVWVTAGSELSGEHYAKQVQLERGAPVTILGQMGDYYKIAPPEGATLYIARDYVRILNEPVSGADLSVPPAGAESGAAEGPLAEGEAASSADAADGAGDDAGDPAATGAPSGLPAGDSAAASGQAAPADPGPRIDYNKELDQIEADLDIEMAKDPLERNLAPYIERFRKVAAQSQDLSSKQYAQSRVEQLESVSGHADALRQLRELRSQVEADRARLVRERANIKPQPVQLARDYDVRGLFLKSFAYDNPVGYRRYRIIDPADDSRRTIAYVEIDPQSGIDGETFVGRHVGVRAQGQRLLEGAVDPLIVYTAAEIVILEAASDAAAPSEVKP